MISNDILSALVHDSYTEHAFRRRCARLQELLELKLYSGKAHASTETLLDDYFEHHNIPHAERAWFLAQDPKLFETFTTHNLYELLGDIRDAFDQLPVATIYVPFVLSGEAVDELGKWFRREVNPMIVMHIAVEPDLGAGAALAWKGIYHDFSFRYLLRQHEDELLKTIREHEHAT